jgi:Family of unknown function (DUF6084)
MSEIDFKVLDARPQPYAAAPTLAFRMRLTEPSDAAIHSIALHCQIRIEPQRRRYSKQEEERLQDLFGQPPQWGFTLKPFLWTHADMMVPGFSGSAEIDLHVPCTYDFEVAAAKYLHSLGDGEIPLLFLFNGSVFAKAQTGLRVSQLAWHKDATYRMPVRVWRALMDMYFPNSGWLRLHRDTLDELLKFKASNALLTWEQVIEVLLEAAGGKAA